VTAPQTIPAPVEAGETSHIVCCDPHVAVCGAEVSGDGWEPGPDDGPVDCLLCAIADAEDLPCGNPECWGADE